MIDRPRFSNYLLLSTYFFAFVNAKLFCILISPISSSASLQVGKNMLMTVVSALHEAAYRLYVTYHDAFETADGASSGDDARRLHLTPDDARLAPHLGAVLGRIGQSGQRRHLWQYHS